jgi:hypothetical protein
LIESVCDYDRDDVLKTNKAGGCTVVVIGDIILTVVTTKGKGSTGTQTVHGVHVDVEVVGFVAL